jgi:hypothetical protein
VVGVERLFVGRKMVVVERFEVEKKERFEKLFEVETEVPVWLDMDQMAMEEFGGDCKVAFQEEGRLQGKVCRLEDIR